MSEETFSGDDYSQAAAVPQSEPMETQSGQPQEGQNVPLAALQAERAQRQRMEDELRLIKDHLSLMQATQTQVPAQKEADEFEGLTDKDVLTVGEAKKLMQRFNNQFQMSVDELKVAQKYTDYQDVVTRYLPEVLKTTPSLKNSLLKSQDYELAYYLAKNSDKYRKENKTTKRNADAERIIQNASQGASMSSVGGTSPIQTAKQYSKMSDDDFSKEVARNLGFA